MDTQFADLEPDELFAEMGRSYFAKADDAIFVVNRAGQVVEANAAGCKLTGYGREALLAFSLSDLFFIPAPAERPFCYNDLSPGKTVPGILRDGNGRSLPVDIETRHLAESHLFLILRFSQTHPQIDQNLFQSLSKNPVMGFWILDEAGCFLEVNEGYLRRSGYSRQALLAMSIGDVTVSGMPGETAADLQTVMKQGYGSWETRHRKKSGEIWPVEISITYANGRFFNFAQDITERKHLEDELRRKGSALEKSLNGFDIISSEGKFLYANQAYLTMWGYDSLDEILGTSPAGHCADPAIPEKIIRNLEEKGEYTLEFTALRKDGSTFKVIMAAPKVVDDQGVVTYSGTSIDITEREQARLALLAEHTRLRQLLDTIPDMVWLKDPNGAYLGCNPPFERLMGVKEAELLGKTDYEFFDQETAEFFRRHDRNAALAGKPTRNEEWLTLADDGRRLLVETIKTPLLDENGQLVGVLGIARDITERKQVQAALQESQEQYQRLFDTMQRGVVYQGADGIILSMNPAAERILGKTKAEFLGETSESVEHDTLTEDGLPFPGLEHPSMVALRTGQPVYDVPMQVYNPREQQYRLISITAVPLFRDDETEPYQVYTVFDDITERRKAEKALRQSEERLRVAIKNSNFIPAQFDKELRYRWIYNPHPDFDLLQVIGKRDDELDDSEGSKQLIALKQQVMDSGIGLRQEVDFLRSDGLHVYDFTIEPLYDDNGAVIGGTTAAFDVTRRKQAEQALYLMSDTQKQIAILDDLETIYRLVGENVLKLIGDGYIVTSMLDEEAQGMRIVGMFGFGRVYQNLVQRFNIDPTKMIYPVAEMTDEELRIYRSGYLEAFEEGIYGLLTRKVPRRICKIVEKQLKVTGTYTMGFVWHDKHYGGISIMAKQDISPFKEMIEAIMNQAAIAINRIKSEQALRESEERLRLFIDHAPASLAMFDREMRYLAASRRWLADFGFDDRDVIGRCHYDVFPEITERWKAIHRRGLAGEVLRDDEDEFIRIDGSVQWLRWEVRPWTTANGQIGGIVIFSEDITESKEAAAALQEMAGNMAKAEAVAKIGSWKWDLNTQKVAWSAEMYSLFGVDIENFDGDINKVISTRIHPDDIEVVNRSNQSVLEHLNPQPLEYRIVLPDGSQRIVWAEGQITYDQSGNPANLVGYVQDITERKQAERALNESQAVLAGAEAVANMGSWKWDIVTQKASWSEGVFKVLAVDLAIFDGNLMGLIDSLINPDDKESAYQAAQAMFIDYKPCAIECRIVPPNDTERMIWVEGRITHDQNGRPTAVVGYIQDITERRQAERALRESEERYHSTLENMLEGCQIIGFDWRYLYLNSSAAWHGRIPKEELIGKTMMEVYPGIENTKLFTIMRHCMEERKPHRLDNKFYYEDGSYAWFDLSVQPVPEGLFILSIDITENKRAEVTLREMAENMAAAQQMTHSGSWEIRLTPDLEFIDPQIWSDECYRIFGTEPGSIQMTKEFFYDHVHPDDREMAFQALQQAVQTGGESIYEYRLIRLDGSVRTIRDRVKAVVNEQTGRPVKVMGIVQDVTESRQAEATIEQLNRQMELILNSAGEGIYGADVNGRIAFVNPAMAQMTGWEPDELLGQNAHNVFHHTRADGTAYPADECAIYIAMLEGREYHADEDLYWRKDGTSLDVEYISTPIREADQIIGMVMVVKDITERKRAAERQGMLEEQLRQAQKMESIGRLAGGVAHDFNNQLTIIKLYSDLIRSAMAKDDPLLSKLEQIRQASDHAAGLTGQLLAFSRKQILQPVTLNLNQKVAQLQKMLSRLIGEDILLSTNLAPDLWSVTADPGQIEQIIMNLIVNARDAMPTGGMVTIETANRVVDEVMNEAHFDIPPGPCVMLAITDTGHGMDEATRRQIFEPFFTTKPAGRGTGLGLATVYGIVKQSGGAIFVYSEPGQGSTFKIYLPAGSTVVQEEFADQEEVDLPLGDETILLVEDDETLRELVRDTLEEFGYTVLESVDVGEALTLAEQNLSRIDLLLTDVVMPQMSGRELADQIVAQRSEIKVVFMSGYMDDAVVRHGLLAAKVNFLPKPFTRSELTSKVRAVLDKS
ncbi:MAG: PAS domain S-box protein [Ardenticatenaceae bacterium]|nr:PAS domain S-box protein [Ardenticatenaceae bacterium]MCB9446596.1 PAS domain S-box protein [Ardenticatenaceae bacterium]